MNPKSKIEFDQTPTGKDRELKWMLERSTRITASGLAKLNTGGRSKAEIFGKTAIEYIDDIVFHGYGINDAKASQIYDEFNPTQITQSFIN